VRYCSHADCTLIGGANRRRPGIAKPKWIFLARIYTALEGEIAVAFVFWWVGPIVVRYKRLWAAENAQKRAVFLVAICPTLM